MTIDNVTLNYADDHFYYYYGGGEGDDDVVLGEPAAAASASASSSGEDDSGVWVHGDRASPFGASSNAFGENGTMGNWTDVSVEVSTAAMALHVLKAMTLCTIIFLAIFSNLLVVISVMRYHKLRHINNYFLVSLAVADLLVACFAMTFNATVAITGHWKFGYYICDLWNSLDVHFSTVSTLHLCCISVDRYYAIVRPLKYTSYMTVKVAWVMIGVAWTAPTLISFLPIFLGWYTTTDHQEWRKLHPNECIFRVNKPYAFISSTLTFWVPVGIMLVMYQRIYKEAVRQKEAIRRSSVPSQQHLIVDSDQIRTQFQTLQKNGFSATGSGAGSRNGSAAAMGPRMGIARLMVPPPVPGLVGAQKAPQPPPLALPPPPVITTTDADESSGAAATAASAAAVTETTPLRPDEKETQFGGSGSVTASATTTTTGAASGVGGGDRQLVLPSPQQQAGATDSVKKASDLLTPTTSNSLTPDGGGNAAQAGGVAGAAGAGSGGLGSVGARVRRVSMAMSIASEGKNSRLSFSFGPGTGFLLSITSTYIYNIRSQTRS